MHITPLLYGASQLHVHASAILADPLRLLRLIDEKVCLHEVIAQFISHHSIVSRLNWLSPRTFCSLSSLVIWRSAVTCSEPLTCLLSNESTAEVKLLFPRLREHSLLP
jgi:hypothetical protein